MLFKILNSLESLSGSKLKSPTKTIFEFGLTVKSNVLVMFSQNI